MNPWISFAVIVLMQFVVYTVLAVLNKQTRREGVIILIQSYLLGLVFGVPFDLIVGKYAQLYTYVNGFSLPFLIVNGLFSFGLWQATLVVLRNKRFTEFSMYILCTAFIYECANLFFPVWEWTISEQVLLERCIVALGYIGLALGGAVVARLIFKTEFTFLRLQIAKKVK